MSRASELADRIHPRTDWYEFDTQTWCNEAAAELRRLERLNAELVEALRDLRQRFHSACIAAGSDAWAADAACAKADAALTSATKEQQK